jgi:hypothetical protein
MNYSNLTRRQYLESAGVIGLVGIAGCSSEEGNSTETKEHKIGETFTVGSGEKTVEYTINSWDTFGIIGNNVANKEPDGRFVVVNMKMKNTGKESFRISSNIFKLVDGSDSEFSTSSLSTYIDQDARINSTGIISEQLQPDLSTTGAVGFDVPPGATYSLKIEPAGLFSGADPHIVSLGEVSEPTTQA